MSDDRRRGNETAEQRRKRLAAELRANLAKRKAQARARAGEPGAATGASTPEDGEAAGGKPGN